MCIRDSHKKGNLSRGAEGAEDWGGEPIRHRRCGEGNLQPTTGVWGSVVSSPASGVRGGAPAENNVRVFLSVSE